MTIGRPTEFNRQEALEKSMALFWKKGYEATSMADLIQEMGIGRQSLYNTFGDKHALFVEAAKHYIANNGRHFVDGLSEPGSPVENIRNVLEQVVDFLIGGKCRGCLITNSIVELAPHDQEVAKMVRSMIQRVEKAFKSTLDQAVAESELAAETDTRAVARFLNSTVHGLVVMGKASASRAALNDVVKIAMTTLE